MARKIAVEGGGHLKKSVAELLVRRLLAVWVVRGVSIRRLPIQEIPFEAASIRIHLPARPYIPAKMPPVEVGGCHFQGPLPDPESTVPHFVKIMSLGV